MRLIRLLALTCLLLAALPRPARADATLFIGSTTTPAHRTTKGFAVGAGILIVGVEAEYASTPEDTATSAPQLRTGSGNVYVQTPVPLAGLQFYATTGAGGYRERLGTVQETNIAFNTGGGVKVSLLGPVKARLDYRVFKLRGAPLHPTAHRLYAGINIGF
jgi:opacity protein-like surface antigen